VDADDRHQWFGVVLRSELVFTTADVILLNFHFYHHRVDNRKVYHHLNETARLFKWNFKRTRFDE
jgi:hypothetical protein